MRDRARAGVDYYGLMGLEPEATEEEIRKAYRRLAFERHPDRNPGKPEASERFKQLSEAYAVLIDPVRRRTYDGARRSGAPSDWSRQREDLFRDLFANPRASAVFEELAREFARTGMRVDRHYFHQTLFGGRATVAGGVFIVTPFTPALVLLKVARAALRAAYGHRPGPVSETRAAIAPGSAWATLGRFARRLLGVLDGAGATPLTRDHDVVLSLRLTQAELAEGARKQITVETDDGQAQILVTIPAGVRPGTKLRLKGRGRPSGNGPRGDLYLVIQ